MLDSALGGTATDDDPALRSASVLEDDTVLPEPAPERGSTRPSVSPARGDGRLDRAEPVAAGRQRQLVRPRFYGKRTACGLAYTQTIVGVAHRSLACGTKIAFRNPANGRVVVARVIDRGPYVSGRQWDLSAGLCKALGHCYTGSLYWKYG
jgi:hypothetical protein